MTTENIEIPERGLLIHHIPRRSRITLLESGRTGFTEEDLDVVERLVHSKQNVYASSPIWISLEQVSISFNGRHEGSTGYLSLLTTTTKGIARKTERRWFGKKH